MTDKQLLAIDMGSLFWSAWHGSANAELSAARDKTLGQVMKLRSQFPGLVALAFDSPESWRKAELPAYKSHRPAKDHVSLEQLALTEAALAGDGLPCFTARKFEADDVLAALTAEARKRGIQVVIASADKDLTQLVAEGVTVVSTATGLHYVNAQAVRDKFGVDPNQMGDFLALVGDPSDGIPGVPKVGAKAAAKLLEVHGDIAGIYEALRDGSAATPAIDESLRACAEPILLWRRLVELRADAPIDFDALFREPARATKRNVIDAEWTEDDFEPKENQPVENEAKEQPAPAAKSAPEAPPVVEATRPTAIVHVPSGEWSQQLEPASTAGAFTLAKHLFESRLYTNFPNAQSLFAVILRGRSLGLDAATSLSVFHIVEGRPTMHASLIVGLVLRSGRAEYFDLVESTRDKATWVTKRKGARRETTLTWTITDAFEAGLVEKVGDDYRGVSRSGKPSNWTKYRRTMLRWRAGVELARAIFPDIVAGLYSPDEFGDDHAIETTLAESQGDTAQ